MDYLLRTTTYAAMESALIAANLVTTTTDTQGDPLVLPVSGAYVDHVGPIPDKKDINGNVISPGDTRWHTNLRVTFNLTAAQVALLPTFTPAPTIPYRVFA
jgi:hypothetical protein